MTGTVIPAQVWQHTSGRQVSVRGALPWVAEAEKAQWTRTDVGFTILWPDGTSGIGRTPFVTREAAQAYVDAHPTFPGMQQD